MRVTTAATSGLMNSRSSVASEPSRHSTLILPFGVLMFSPILDPRPSRSISFFFPLRYSPETSFAALTALLQPQDRLMGLGLPDGGHLTHGYYVNSFLVSQSYIRSFHVDSQEEDDCVVDLFPVIPIWAGSCHTAY
jgi:hypothetical protein